MSLRLDVPLTEWPTIEARRLPGEAPPIWPASDEAARFVPCVGAVDTVGALLDAARWRVPGFAESGVTKKKVKDRWVVTLRSAADRSSELLDEVGNLPRVLGLARVSGAKGKLLVVSDGAAPEPGWQWTLRDGKVSVSPLGESEAASLADALAAELGVEEALAPAPTTRSWPQLDRLDAGTLEVALRASAEPQDVHVRVVGSRKPGIDSYYPGRIDDVARLWGRGQGGGALFAPEAAKAEVVSGPSVAHGRASPDPDDGVFDWKLRIASIDPRTLVACLADLADSWAPPWGARNETDPRYFPSRVSMTGSLPLDTSSASARTEDVLGWLRDRSALVPAWPDLPFALKEAVGPGLVVIAKTSAPPAKGTHWRLVDVLHCAASRIETHPGWVGHTVPNAKASKTQLKAEWSDASCPRDVFRGPVLNALRWFHFEVAALTSVELRAPR